MDIISKNKDLILEVQNKTRFKRMFYIIEYSNGVKIGITTNAITRLKQYVKPWCYPVEAIYLSTSSQALTYENKCKKAFKSKTNASSTEFFEVSAQDIIDFLELPVIALKI